MALDRTIAPNYKQIEDVKLIKATEERLQNNIPLYIINSGTQDLIRIEFIFSAGSWHQSHPLVAYATNQLLEEGTKTLTASEIADKLDYFGAFLETEPGPDSASLVLYTLNKHLASTLPVVEDIIKNPVFPRKEFDTFIQNKKQKLLVELQKVNHVARKKFGELIFGESHPYGYYTTAKDYDNLKIEYLAEFHASQYTPENCKIIISGKVSEQSVSLIKKHFGSSNWKNSDRKIEKKSAIEVNTIGQPKNIVFKKDAIQSALRVGRLLFNKTHPDYLPMQILNTILGGYFGSRLMANIREDKGYTYGIGSNLISQKNAGYFVISSEVGVDVCSSAINEIFLEIKRLREEEINESELQLVKNYMLGVFLKSIDGPFALADRFKGILEYNLGYDYYDTFLKTIKTISAKDLMALANKYLQEDSLIELVVGKK